MYVNIYLIPVPGEQKEAYTKTATAFAEVAAECGALQVFENWELEVPDGELTDYRKAVQAQEGEKVAVAWVVWPDRETGARAHKAMYEGDRLAMVGEPPYDSARMVLGGFEPLVSYIKPSP